MRSDTHQVRLDLPRMPDLWGGATRCTAPGVVDVDLQANMPRTGPIASPDGANQIDSALTAPFPRPRLGRHGAAA